MCCGLIDGDQYHNIGNEQVDVSMDAIDMDESAENDLNDVTDEADPGLLNKNIIIIS
jgi:hypothetical protein